MHMQPCTYKRAHTALLVSSMQNQQYTRHQGLVPPPLAHRDGNTVVPCRAGLHVLMAIEGTSHVLCMTENRHLCICACEYVSMHVSMHEYVSMHVSMHVSTHN